jgi:hypothetical protein
MRFVCQLRQQDGHWAVVHTGPDVGPIRVAGRTREEALRKMEAEIRYWLEMCPCSGQTRREIQIELS